MKPSLATFLVCALCLAASALADEKHASVKSEIAPTALGACPPSPAGGNTPFDPCTYLPLGKAVKMGRRIAGGEPAYSEAAQKPGIKGTVVLAVALDDTGNIREVRVVRTLDARLDQNATDAVKKWKFAPATKDNHPVAVQFYVEVVFNML